MDESYSPPPPELPIAIYRACFISMDSSVDSSVESRPIPGYLGSAVRGAFGHALKKTVCVTRQTTCKECLLYRSCAYPYIFETPPPADTQKMRRYSAAPHPFVFALPFSPRVQRPGKVLEIGFSLFGRGNQLLPYMVHALEEAGKSGIGKHCGKRQSLRLQDVQQCTDFSDPGWSSIYQSGQKLSPLPPASPGIPTMPDRILIHFQTPLRLSRDKRNIGPEPFQFADLFITLLRRISMLSYFHTDKAHETDFAALAGQARSVLFSRKQLCWHDWQRYSSRQKTNIKMGGLMGRVGLEMKALEAFWPYLWLGQWTHVGKGTSMGLGHYRIETAAD